MATASDRSKVLYIEDEPLMRTIISKLLAQEGLTVRTAHNGQAGLETACEYRPDLILMDLMMPVMNGYDAARTLRAEPRTEHTPIVAFSAVEGASARERALAAGMNDFVSKTSSHAQLAGVVRFYLRSMNDASA